MRLEATQKNAVLRVPQTTKCKQNQILNLWSFDNISRKGNKSKIPCYDSGKNLDRKNEQENIRK